MQREQFLVDAVEAAQQTQCQPLDAEPHSQGELRRLMNIPAEARQPDQPDCEVYTVVAKLERELPGATWTAVVGGQERLVRKAVSCVVTPGCGDQVQVLMQGDKAWILAILERGQPQERLVLDFGDAEVRVSARQLEFEAAQRIAHKANELSSVSMAVTEVTQEHCTYVKQARIVQAGSMHVDVDQHLRIHSSLTTVMADALLKLDGAQIHMG